MPPAQVQSIWILYAQDISFLALATHSMARYIKSMLHMGKFSKNQNLCNKRFKLYNSIRLNMFCSMGGLKIC